MRKLLRYALSLILVATWLVATLSTEPAKAEPRDLIKQAYRLAERLDWDYCASSRRTAERAEQLLSQLAEAYRQATASGDTRLVTAIDNAGEELADALDWYYEDCGGPNRISISGVGSGFYYIPGTDTAIQIGGYVRTAIEFSGEIGQLNRPNFGSALQLENAGNLINSQFGYVTRKDDYQAFEVKGTIPLRSGHVNGLMVGYRFGTASNDSNLGALSTGGNDLNIYSPAGSGGGLGGGVSVNDFGIGFANITNLRYADTYSEHLGYFGWLHDPCNIRATGASFTPYAKVIVGYVRESSSYSGTTAAGGLTFGYSNQLDTWRGGVELGGHLKQPLGANFGLYGDAAVRFIYNKASIDSSLNFSGLVNATESGSASANKFDVGFAGGGGVYVQNGNATFSAGVAVESWQVPTVNYSFSAPVGVNFDDRWSVSGKLALKLAF